MEARISTRAGPLPETFLLLEGHGRWTAGDEIVELRPNQMLVVPPRLGRGPA